MNIFILDSDPIKSAQYLCDKHIVKMALETAQVLCSIYIDAPYKRTHYNHPACVWAHKSKQNYQWLIQHGLAICLEYTFRYGKHHKSEDVIKWCENKQNDLPDVGLTEFAQCMPDEYKNIDSVIAYRNYYRLAKSYLLKYTKRDFPDWLK